MPPIPPTKSEDRVSVKTKLAYGAGMSAERLQTGSINQLANPIFNDVLGMDPRIVGLAMGASRVVDAVTDPVMGYISDGTESRWGRRRPWMVLAAVLCATIYGVFWMFPRGMDPTFYVIWFVVGAVLFQACQSIFSAPYGAMGMELTPDYHERTSVMAYRSIMAKLGGFLVSSLFVVLTLDVFDDMADGIRYVGPILGVIMLFMMLAPAIFTREHPRLEGSAKARKIREKGFWRGSLQTLRNGPFVVLLVVSSIMLLGLTMVSHLSYYLTIYFMFGGERSVEAGLLLTVSGYAGQIGGLCGLPVMLKLARRFGKKHTLMGGLAVAALGDLSKWFCFVPENPYLALIPNFWLAFVLSSAWALTGSMLPDIVDFDELRTGERREGMFSGIQGWIIKLGTSIALIASGFVLSASGFESQLGPAQAEGTITFIRLCYVFVPAVAMLVAMAVLQLYPLNEKRAYAIRAQLEKRRQRNESASGD